jgi:hypothetical protein
VLLLLCPIALHYLAYSFFYATWRLYGHETLPFVQALVARGLIQFWRLARDSDRPGGALVVPLVVAAALGFEMREVFGFVQKRQEETAEVRDFQQRIDEKIKEPAIVFVRIDPARYHEYDLVRNSPGLSDRVLIALDLGDRNAELLDAFPGRRGYVLNEARGTLTPWSPPSRVPPPAGRSIPAQSLVARPGRGQKSGVRSQRSEVRGQRSFVGPQNADL